jgi:hypothetical protein
MEKRTQYSAEYKRERVNRRSYRTVAEARGGWIFSTTSSDFIIRGFGNAPRTAGRQVNP